MCTTATCKRRRKQMKLDPRYKTFRKDAAARARRAQMQQLAALKRTQGKRK